MNPESFLDGKVTLYPGDCLEVLAGLPENSVDLCACDPPYHLTSIVKRFGGANAAEAQHGSDGAFARAARGFMGKVWDGGDIAFRPEVWAAVLRVLKPGGHLLAFGSSRGYGHMQVAIEQAGFETRDCILDMIDADPAVAAFVDSLNDAQRVAFLRIVVESSDVGGLMAWVFGTGFPKSHNIALDFEKQLCDEISVDGRTQWRYRSDGAEMARVAPFRDDRANAASGAGTALKPAFEPIVMARKPVIGSVAENFAAFGTGPINIDAARIHADDAKGGDYAIRRLKPGAELRDGGGEWNGDAMYRGFQKPGRWPANVIHDGSAAVVSAFPESEGNSGGIIRDSGADSVARGAFVPTLRGGYGGGSGSASRFFWSPKADAHDRIGSKHPTVKPVDIMQYLIEGFSFPGHTVLDPFAGTGTTGEAAFRYGRKAILIERETEYQADIRRRMTLCLAGPEERKRESIKAKTADAPVDAGPLFGSDA